jgi:myo-inositol-1(or 4)-monophosphatase
MNSYENEIKIAREIAKKSGKILFEGWENGTENLNIKHKGDIDLVTQYDLASEKLIVEELKKHFPEDKILAEEQGGKRDEGRLWCVDPLDGTTNFSHGLPFFCVSIALLIDGKSVLGVVLAPAMFMEFYAIKGNGAFLNGKKLKQLKNNKNLINGIVCYGCGYDRCENPDRYVPMIEEYMKRSQGLRRLGSAAFDCCLVARGWYDAYVEVNLHPWDLAAGCLIASETGAKVTDVNGESFDPFSGRILVAKPDIHAEMVEVGKSKHLFDGEFSGRWS